MATPATAGLVPDFPVAHGTWDPRLYGQGVARTPYVIAASDDKVYVAGDFLVAGDAVAGGLAVWDASTSDWSAIPGAIEPGTITSLATFKGDLFAAGYFRFLGGKAVAGFARWDGASWESLGAYNSESSYPLRLRVVDDALYVFGSFSTEDLDFAGIGRWDGTEWSTVPYDAPGALSVALQGFDAYVARYRYPDIAGVLHYDGNTVSDLDWDSGAPVFLSIYQGELYVAGPFEGLGPDQSDFIARWDGESWRKVGGGLPDEVSGLEVIDDCLYAVTNDYGDDAQAWRYDGVQWSSIGDFDTTDSFGPSVHSAAQSGGLFFVTGDFTSVNGQYAPHAAYFDPSDESWHAVRDVHGYGLDDQAYVAIASDSGFYIGGKFASAGGEPTGAIARWSSPGWEAVGNSGAVRIRTLASGGSDLYAAGDWDRGDGTVHGVSKWDGTAWGPVHRPADGFQFGAIAFANGKLYAVHNDFGSNYEGDVVAVWDDAEWSFLPSRIDDSASSIAVMDNGDVFIAGSIGKVGNIPVSRIARWNGHAWSDMGFVDGGFSSIVAKGNSLYVGGTFTAVDGVAARGVARWENGVWHPLVNLDGHVRRIALDGETLYATVDYTNYETLEYVDDVLLRLVAGRWENLGTASYAVAARGGHAIVAGDRLVAGGIASHFAAHWSNCDLDVEICPDFHGPCGDPDGDGDVDSSDAFLALRAAVGAADCALSLCDVNSSGALSVIDAQVILHAAVDLPVILDCPEPS